MAVPTGPEGQKISYEVQTERGREAAVNLKA
jgi:hypothetical protein